MFNLRFEQQRDLPLGQSEEGFEPRDRMTADAQVGEIRPIRASDLQRAGAQPARIGVMEYYDLVIRGEPDVALDAGTERDRGAERGQRVFGYKGIKMKAAVGESARTWIEGIRA